MSDFTKSRPTFPSSKEALEHLLRNIKDPLVRIDVEEKLRGIDPKQLATEEDFIVAKKIQAAQSVDQLNKIGWDYITAIQDTLPEGVLIKYATKSLYGTPAVFLRFDDGRDDIILMEEDADERADAVQQLRGSDADMAERIETDDAYFYAWAFAHMSEYVAEFLDDMILNSIEIREDGDELKQIFNINGKEKVMSKEKKGDYQGWKNYPTWAVALWIDNDRGVYETVMGMAEGLSGQSDDPNAYASDTITLADQIKELVEADNPVADSASMWADLMQSSLDEVDWREVAQSYLEK